MRLFQAAALASLHPSTLQSIVEELKEVKCRVRAWKTGDEKAVLKDMLVNNPGLYFRGGLNANIFPERLFATSLQQQYTGNLTTTPTILLLEGGVMLRLQIGWPEQ